MRKTSTLQFFKSDHLKEPLKSISQPFEALATHLEESLPSNPEKSTAMRKLLEAKDCAVRAAIYKEGE